MSIEWHKEALKNNEIYILKEENQLKERILKLAKDKESLKFRCTQIEIAEAEGKTEFDPDRFLIKRK